MRHHVLRHITYCKSISDSTYEISSLKYTFRGSLKRKNTYYSKTPLKVDLRIFLIGPRQYFSPQYYFYIRKTSMKAHNLLFLPTNELSLGGNKSVSCLEELLEMIFKLNHINLI
jgi:hypothetical protein